MAPPPNPAPHNAKALEDGKLSKVNDDHKFTNLKKGVDKMILIMFFPDTPGSLQCLLPGAPII